VPIRKRKGKCAHASGGADEHGQSDDTRRSRDGPSKTVEVRDKTNITLDSHSGIPQREPHGDGRR